MAWAISGEPKCFKNRSTPCICDNFRDWAAESATGVFTGSMYSSSNSCAYLSSTSNWGRRKNTKIDHSQRPQFHPPHRNGLYAALGNQRSKPYMPQMPSGVHSTNSASATSSGRTHTHSLHLRRGGLGTVSRRQSLSIVDESESRRSFVSRRSFFGGIAGLSLSSRFDTRILYAVRDICI